MPGEEFCIKETNPADGVSRIKKLLQCTEHAGYIARQISLAAPVIDPLLSIIRFNHAFKENNDIL